MLARVGTVLAVVNGVLLKARVAAVARGASAGKMPHHIDACAAVTDLQDSTNCDAVAEGCTYTPIQGS